LYNFYVISNRNSTIPKEKFLIQFFDFKNKTNKNEDSIMVENKTAILNAKLQAKQSTKVGFVAIARIVPLLVLIGILGNFYGLVGLSLAVLFSTIIESSFLFVLFLKSKN